jgi:putative transposase
MALNEAGSVALTDWCRSELYACYMTKLPTDITEHRYKRHRFPAEIIGHAVWLYHRFPLSLRDVEDPLAERGIDVSFQTVSEWAVKFGR